MLRTRKIQRKYLKRSWDIDEAKSAASIASVLGLTESEIEKTNLPAEELYSTWTVPKSNGEDRQISAPSKPLRVVQKKILEKLYKAYRNPHFLHGGLPKKSIFSLANEHVNKKTLMWIDISNFFPSISLDQVENCFSTMGYTPQIAIHLSQLTTAFGSLPQGGITSSMLANVVGLEFDDPILKISKRHSLSYGRYIDDIYVSGNHDFRELKGPIVDRVLEAGFEVSDKVTSNMFTYNHERQLVCGLVVNTSVRPSNKLIETSSAAVDSLLKNDYGRAAEILDVELHAIKPRINGLVQFLLQGNTKKAPTLKRKLYGVDWKGLYDHI